MSRKRSTEESVAVLLRQAVRDHATVERRRHHVPLLHVGVPGQPHEVFAIVPGEPTDQALRTDIVAAMRWRDSCREGAATSGRLTLVWLTRSGGLDLQDLDATWHAAARQAYAEADVPLHFAVVNRRGWHQVGSGARREWSRPRPTTDRL